MSANILDAVNKLATIKQLDSEEIHQIIKDSVAATLGKRLGPENELEVYVDDESKMIQATFMCEVVELEEGIGQMSLTEARSINPDAELGDMIERSMSLQDFEPKLAKTTQNAILEKIQKLEDDKIQSDYNKLKNTIVSGQIKVIGDDMAYHIDTNHTSAKLPLEEQIEDEVYRVGDYIRAYVISTSRSRRSKTTVINLSRTNPAFVEKLFESEIPEIADGQIVIRKIVREPGVRTKVELESLDPRLDPVRVCVGPKGTRIDNIRAELRREQIDIVVHSEDPEQMVINALGIEDGVRQVIIERNRVANVIVNDESKVMAIGKQGKNVKLAAKLTGLKIEIYTTTEYDNKMAKQRRTVSHITELDGVNVKIAETLRAAGYTSVQDIYAASVEELCNIEGVGEKTAERLKEAAEYF